MTKRLSLLFLMFLMIGKLYGQQSTQAGNLSRKVTIQVKNQKITEVLNQISAAGNFYFSYQGNLFNTDSLVNVSVQNATVMSVLDRLFKGKLDYKENGQYIILRSAALRLTIEPDNITTAVDLYLISGYVVDTKTGARVKQASVYEKRLLQSTLTNNDGYFKLRFRGDHNEVILTASKEFYRDTTLIFLSNITIKPESYQDTTASNKSRVSNMVESLGIGRFFVSSKQRIQSLNIGDFLATSPVQTSFTPGLSSHGMMSSQIINKVSLNILGGYSAGLNGFELAGMFNMDKTDVRYFQAAGLLNIVGGSVEGFQLAGAMNSVIGNSDAFMAAGLINSVRSDAYGLQLIGAVNQVKGNASGVQAAGLYNYVKGKVSGLQIAGAANIVNDQVDGVQIAGLFNYAKKLKGVQFGLVNLADSSSGYSFGLINLVRKNGICKVSISANELMNTNLSLKTGTRKLYSILMVGQNISSTEKIGSAGIGFGHEFLLGKKLSLATELSSLFLYLGDSKYSPSLNKLQANLQIRIFKGLTLFGGPSYTIYNSDQLAGSGVKGYKQQVPPSYSHRISDTSRGWLGWNAGITLF